MKKKKSTPLLQNLLEITALSQQDILAIFERADQFLKNNVELSTVTNCLQGKILVNLFFEPSTRTRNSFTIAAQRLGAMVINPNMAYSAAIKGESLIDTIHTFEAMGANIFVVRHAQNNMPHFIASETSPNTAVINAGDGTNQHPTQALLDLFTIKQFKTDFENLKIAIVGDVAHSRVARSLIQGLQIMGAEDIRVIAPKSFVPEDADALGITVFSTVKTGLQDVDVVVTLRMQTERMQPDDVPEHTQFFKAYGLTSQRLAFAKPDAIVMHPGPINRGVEIETDVANGPQSVILQQVRNGIAIRMAVINLF